MDRDKNHGAWIDVIFAYLTGEGGLDEYRALEEHLRDCPMCRVLLRDCLAVRKTDFPRRVLPPAVIALRSQIQREARRIVRKHVETIMQNIFEDYRT